MPPWLPAGTVLFSIALGFFAFALRRRRGRGEPPLATAGAASSVPAVAIAPEPSPGGGIPTVLTGVRADVSPDEAAIPRWRRPSVQEARFSHAEAKPSAPRERLAFKAPAEAGVERLVVRYDLVSLLDSPGNGPVVIVADLRSGDQLDVVSRHDGWVRARTPGGAVGWVSASIVKAIDEDWRGAMLADESMSAPSLDAQSRDGAASASPAGSGRPKPAARAGRSKTRTAARPAAKPSGSTARVRRPT
jgi:hypothetical protein